MDETTQAQPTETQAPVTEQPAGETTNAQVQAELAPTQAETTAPEVSEVAEPTTGTDVAPTSNEGAAPVVANAQEAESSAEAAPAGTTELDAPVTEAPAVEASAPAAAEVTAPVAPETSVANAPVAPAAETPVETLAPVVNVAPTTAGTDAPVADVTVGAAAIDAPSAPVAEATVSVTESVPAEAPQGQPVEAEPIAQVADTASAVDAAPVVAAPPIVQEVAEPADEASTVPLTEFQQMIKKIMDEGTAVQKQVVQRLEAYVESMAPGKPVEPSTGAALQYELWSVIEFIFDAAPREEFTMLWNLLLGYFREHEKGVFGARYVNRFSESWKNSSMKLTGFQRILNLLSVTARPENRAEGLKSVDINSTLTNGITPEGRARILGFYNK